MDGFKNWISEDKSPDYSMDRWVKMAQELGGNINSMVGGAKDKEKELDDEGEAKKRDADKEDKDSKDRKDHKDHPDKDQPDETLDATDVTKDKSTEGEWEKLKKIAKDQIKKKASSTKPEKSEKG